MCQAAYPSDSTREPWPTNWPFMKRIDPNLRELQPNPSMQPPRVLRLSGGGVVDVDIERCAIGGWEGLRERLVSFREGVGTWARRGEGASVGVFGVSGRN